MQSISATFADSAPLAVKLVKNGTLKVYPGAPHGLATTLKDAINADPKHTFLLPSQSLFLYTTEVPIFQQRMQP